MLNIVFLDGSTLDQNDLDWSALEGLGNTQIYPSSSREEGWTRGVDADIILTNKYQIDQEALDHWPKVKCISVTATGFNVIDLEATSTRGITVCNAPAYSTMSTAQHTIALLLELTNQVGDYSKSVKANDWHTANEWTYYRRPLIELSSRTLGIIGLGNIGLRVARIAQSLGMNVIATKRQQHAGTFEGIPIRPLDVLFRTSDVVSLHAPLTDQTFGIVNRATLGLMKKSAFLINTSRGGLIVEADLHDALTQNKIAGAALDVLMDEPPRKNHPLNQLENCFVTPHVAWASSASRQRLLDITCNNVSSFISGSPQNVVKTS